MKVKKLLEKIKNFLFPPLKNPNIVHSAPAKEEPPTPQPLDTLHSLEKQRRINDIRLANQQRRQKFTNSEHFKQRRSSVARSQWNPQAKIEDD